MNIKDIIMDLINDNKENMHYVLSEYDNGPYKLISKRKPNFFKHGLRI